MNWNINKAIIIGRDHEFSKKNRQDFCAYKTGQRICGVICDGCSQGEYSEIGATLLGNFILSTLSTADIMDEKRLYGLLVSSITVFYNKVLELLKIDTAIDRIEFIGDYFLSTFLFCLIDGDRTLIGSSGDGVIITNTDQEIIDQDNQPNYMAYRIIPRDRLSDEGYQYRDLVIRTFPTRALTRIAIASDGLKPLLDRNGMEELFGTEKRQLQRKMNVLQSREKIFNDDISVLVFEAKSA